MHTERHAPTCGSLSPVCVCLCACVQDADLVVLHGMGRAIHTNYYARFTCDALKVAVIKTEVVARQIGARLFDGVVRFEPAP
jgi:hypothetical protein